MRYYETIYIINPNLAEEDFGVVVAKFNDLIEKKGGVLTKVDDWGKKVLAYEVKNFDRGYYVLLRYCGEQGLTEAFSRDLKLDDRILKFQTVKLSDNLDPETLVANKAEDRTEEEQEAESTVEMNPDQDGGIEEKKEGENGV